MHEDLVFVLIRQVLPLDQLVGSRDKLIFFRRVIDPCHHQGILEVLGPLWRLILQGFFGLNDLVV